MEAKYYVEMASLDSSSPGSLLASTDTPPEGVSEPDSDEDKEEDVLAESKKAHWYDIDSHKNKY